MRNADGQNKRRKGRRTKEGGQSEGQKHGGQEDGQRERERKTD